MADISRNRITTNANSRFAKAGVSCFYDSLVQGLSLVLADGFILQNRQFRQATNC
jgi:hypothetical protein